MLPPSFTPQFLRQLELFQLRSRRAYLGARQGGHVSLKRGHGIEFSDFRKYELGDSPRWIDWGVYARTEKLYVRRYQEEQNLSVLVLIDASSSMRTPEGERKWETARDIALALSYIALMQQDSVIVAPLGGYVSPAYSGARAIHHIGESLLNFSPPEKQVDVADAVQRAVARVRFPGVAILISDFLMPFVEIRAIFNGMMAKNLDMTAIQVLAPSDVNPLSDRSSAVAIDSESGAEVSLVLDEDTRGRYAHLLSTHTKQVRDFCTSRRIGFTSMVTNEDTGTWLIKSLRKTGLFV